MSKKLHPPTKLRMIISRAVEEGAAYATSRFNKYAMAPLSESERDRMHEHIEREVMSALSDVLEFDEG